jgi:ubiquitin-conjugating enzyme E2 C
MATDWYRFYSASPLNGEAAELWDKDPEEFKKKVLGRHRDIEEELSIL